MTPRRIPVGGTVSLSADLNPGEPAKLLVLCAGEGDSDSEECAEDFSVSWPGPFFDDDCDSPVPGHYTVFLATSLQVETESFWVYGDRDGDGDGLGNDDEVVAGTDPLDDDTFDEDGITTLWAGTVLGPADVVEDGEIVGVVIDADPDVEDVSIVVFEPVGSPFLVREILGLTPFTFAFVPILPGDWTIEAELGNGALLTAVVHVIPEPGATLGGLAGATTLLGVGAARRRRPVGC